MSKTLIRETYKQDFEGWTEVEIYISSPFSGPPQEKVEAAKQELEEVFKMHGESSNGDKNALDLRKSTDGWDEIVEGQEIGPVLKELEQNVGELYALQIPALPKGKYAPFTVHAFYINK